jgi:hypothetical protein
MQAATLRAVSRAADRAVVVLGVLAVVAWLGSYSWLLGVWIPMDDLEYSTSPWLVSEVVALVAGAAAVVVALAGSVEGATISRHARGCAMAGGAAAALSLLSLAM